MKGRGWNRWPIYSLYPPQKMGSINNASFQSQQNDETFHMGHHDNPEL